MELCGGAPRYNQGEDIWHGSANHEDAEDALQDTLLRAYTHLDSFRQNYLHICNLAHGDGTNSH